MNEPIDTWFNSFDRLASVAVGAVVLYVFTVLLIRVSGKRTVGQMNNFDWIVTVAVGGLISSGIMLVIVAVLDGMVAASVVTGLQWLMTWLAARFDWFERLVKHRAQLLTHKGKLIDDALRRTRVTKSEVYAELRAAGMLSPDEANWVILETNGKLTVIPYRDDNLWDAETMCDVDKAEDTGETPEPAR